MINKISNATQNGAESGVIVMTCPACNSLEYEYISDVYDKCIVCGTIYAADPIEDLVKTENDNPESRNSDRQHATRLARLRQHMLNVNFILDVGCGNGEFVEFLKRKGLTADGVDKGQQIPLIQYDAITMIEVIEHLELPFIYLNKLKNRLVPKGILYIESTFADDIKDPANHPYVDPKIGHRTILSRKGLALIAEDAELDVEHWIDSHVVILRKI